jgi:hypothetical protein
VQVFKGVSDSLAAFVADKKNSAAQRKIDPAAAQSQLRQMMKDLPQHQQEMAKCVCAYCIVL